MCGGDVEIYNLYLQNTNSPIIIDNSNYANTTFQVNWDALFRSNNYKYKNCRVRAQIISDRVAPYAIGLTTGFLIMRGATSNFSMGVGLDGNVYLLPLYPSNATDSADPTTGYIYKTSTLDSYYGSQMNMPTGIQNISIVFMEDEGSVMAASYVPSSWGLLLQFELSNPKE